jgi:hypothetical protein
MRRSFPGDRAPPPRRHQVPTLDRRSNLDHLLLERGAEGAEDNRVHARPVTMKAIVQDSYGSPDVLELREIERGR